MIDGEYVVMIRRKLAIKEVQPNGLSSRSDSPSVGVRLCTDAMWLKDGQRASQLLNPVIATGQQWLSVESALQPPDAVLQLVSPDQVIH